MPPVDENDQNATPAAEPATDDTTTAPVVDAPAEGDAPEGDEPKEEAAA